MKKEKESPDFVQQEERGHDRPVTDDDIRRLRSAQRLMDDVASRIPPFSTEQIHSVVEGDRLPQFQLRRRCDRYLLIFCLLLLALAASILWHTAPTGATPVNVAVLILAVADAVIALRAARSLWLMRQTLRLRHRPYRMSHYADRLGRLSRRRRRWLGFVLAGSYNSVSTHVDPSTRSTGACTSWQEFFSLRLPSYSIAACLFLLIALNADKAFAATRDYVKVTTTTEHTATAICDNINNTIERQ
ncbi:MAG: hypothetical protein IJR26_06685 [Bacteroidales bacterium]|nr:hypothetical protein [Bacteroidales bacterium]